MVASKSVLLLRGRDGHSGRCRERFAPSRAREDSPSTRVFSLVTRKLSAGAMRRYPCRLSTLPMPRLARPVSTGAPTSRVSKAAASRVSKAAARPLSQSRSAGPPASGSSISPLFGLAAAFLAACREEAVDIPCMCVGAPTTRRSAVASEIRGSRGHGDDGHLVRTAQAVGDIAGDDVRVPVHRFVNH